MEITNLIVQCTKDFFHDKRFYQKY